MANEKWIRMFVVVVLSALNIFFLSGWWLLEPIFTGTTVLIVSAVQVFVAVAIIISIRRESA